VLGAVLLALSLVRLGLVFSSAGGARWLLWFRVSTIALGLALGIQGALVLAGVGRDLALAVTAAIGAVAIFVYAPDLPLVLWFPVALNAPLAAVLLWRGTRPEMILSAADAVFIGYCMTIGRRLHREHWDAARSSRLLREHAAELETAREVLARSRDELERRVEERTRELAEREEDYRRIFESAHDAIIIFDPRDERVLAVNESASKLYGLPVERFLGLSLRTISKDPVRGDDELAETLRLGTRRGFETVRYKADGSEMVLEINASVIPYQGRTAVLSLNRDVTARNWSVAALRESENRYRALFETSPLPLFVCDPDTHALRDANEAAVAHYGYTREELRRMTLLELEASSAEIPRPGSGQEVTSAHRTKDGRRIRVEVVSRDVELDGRPARLVLAHDVTARELLEEELRQARKMEAIGRLAGGVAHDFNNMLTAILGYGELLQEKIGTDQGLLRPLEQILFAGQRAAALTRQLLAFSRKQILAPEVIDLNTLVQNLTGMLARIIGEDVELVTLKHPEPVMVNADPGQIEQVILNLVVNARDAMPHGGRLVLETSVAGAEALLFVRDTGVGMDSEIRKHLFEPFFTTKGQGKGTGLGLATVQGIVEQSGGRVEVSSQPGQGTEFRIALPRCERDPGKASGRGPQPAPTGREHVLVVEDETQVRTLVQKVLEEHGYRVTSAADGEEALRLSSEIGEVDLLLSDLVLPGIGGAELAARLRSSRPGLKVLFVSGYTTDGRTRRRIEENQEEFLQKPFAPAELLRRVRAVIDGAGTAAARPRS